MNIDDHKLKELAALHAAGALDGTEVEAFARLLEASADARREATAFAAVTEALARSLRKGPQPSTGLRERILREAQRHKAQAAMLAHLESLQPKPLGGLAFLKAAGEGGWLPLRVPGAAVKVLSFDPASRHAVLLGKLEPGARYPAHVHQRPEDLVMLSGDLHVGDEVLRPGDFHHAEAGSSHGVNWSEQGCVLVAVLSKEDLLAQFEAT